MFDGVEGEVLLDAGEAQQAEVAASALAKLPVRAPIASVFEALRPCVPFAAGLVGIVRPGAPEAMMAYPVGLPPPVLESWLGMPGEARARVLAPLTAGSPGELWRDSETVTGAFREGLDVIHKLDAFGLGEGAGCKLLTRGAAGDDLEIFFLAILMERRQLVPLHSRLLLAALTSAISAAIQRVRLPFLQSDPISAQIMEQRETGYLCVSRSRALIAANSRAYQLVDRFGSVMGIPRGRGAVAELSARAWELAGRTRTWRLDEDGAPSFLSLNTHVLAKETHEVHEDTLVVVLRETVAPKSRADELIESAGLPPTEKEIADLLAHTELTIKEIATLRARSVRTIEKQADQIYKKLGVDGRRHLLSLAAK